MNKHFLKIGQTVDSLTKKLYDYGFNYEEATDYMKFVYKIATKKYGNMSFYGIDKDGAESVIDDINKQFIKLTTFGELKK